VEVEVDTHLGTTRIAKYVAVHESGRLMRPHTAREQIRSAVMQGIGQALREDLLYDQASSQPLTAGYARTRYLPPLAVPPSDVRFLEGDEGYGPFGAKTVGESGLMLAPAAVANAGCKATGTRMTSLPMSRAKILGAIGCKR
jgi:CO/xanthine dehydrogenase Mo-binding subunit